MLILVCIVFDEVEIGFKIERVLKLQRAECVEVESVGVTFE